MNQGKMWRVVSPSVGVPLCSWAPVAVTALIVHGALIDQDRLVRRLLERRQPAGGQGCGHGTCGSAGDHDCGSTDEVVAGHRLSMSV
jgi:hypothetical protein